MARRHSASNGPDQSSSNKNNCGLVRKMEGPGHRRPAGHGTYDSGLLSQHKQAKPFAASMHYACEKLERQGLVSTIRLDLLSRKKPHQLVRALAPLGQRANRQSGMLSRACLAIITYDSRAEPQPAGRVAAQNRTQLPVCRRVRCDPYGPLEPSYLTYSESDDEKDTSTLSHANLFSVNVPI